MFAMLELLFWMGAHSHLIKMASRKKRSPAVAVPLPLMLEALEGWMGQAGTRDVELLLKELYGRKFSTQP